MSEFKKSMDVLVDVQIDVHLVLGSNEELDEQILRNELNTVLERELDNVPLNKGSIQGSRVMQVHTNIGDPAPCAYPGCEESGEDCRAHCQETSDGVHVPNMTKAKWDEEKKVFLVTCNACEMPGEIAVEEVSSWG